MYNTNWNYLERLNVNEAYDEFSNILLTNLNKLAPLKKVTVPYKYIRRDPWMTKELLKYSDTCQKLYKQTLNRENHDPARINYVHHRNNYNRLKRVAKKEYYKKVLEKHKNYI